MRTVRPNGFGPIVDLFAGGGGASAGLAAVFGSSPDFAIDVSESAIAVHALNHPDTRHVTADVRALRPRSLVKERPQLLWASPPCVHFSRARGGPKGAKTDLRDLSWEVVRWVDALQPRYLLLENVPEFEMWDPACAVELGRSGATFRRFTAAIEALGYSVSWRVLRACDYGAPTLRKRFFFAGSAPDVPYFRWPDPTPSASRAGDCLDLKQLGVSVFDRVRPLCENTSKRLVQGVKRFVLGDGAFVRTLGSVDWAFFLQKNYTGVVGSSLFDFVHTLTTRDHHYLVACRLSDADERFFGGARHPDAALRPAFEAVGRDGRRIVDIRTRMLTADEMFAAQGFPKEWNWRGAVSETAAKHMAGNSVCPPLAKALAEGTL